MKKILLSVSIIICISVIALVFFQRTQDIPENSISFLAGEEKVNVFSFSDKKVVSKVKIDTKSDFPYGITSFNPMNETTLSMVQNSKSTGYHFYMQDDQSLEEIGKTDIPVFGGVAFNDTIYSVVFKDDQTFLQKRKKDNFEKIDEWPLKGNPEKVVADYENELVYVLTRTDKILLYTLNGDHVKEKTILDQSYEINAQLVQDQLWISVNQLVQNSGKKTNNKEVKKVIVYDTKEEKIADTLTTKHPPKFILPSKEETIVFSGTPNSNYLEVINNQDQVTSSEELDEVQEIFGIVHQDDSAFVIARNGIFEYGNQDVTLLDQTTVPDSVDLVIY
ncbi:hypothetical protein NQ095_07705 [Rossellomorea sp. SC111]|uniref:hypothetical protein n=1 Tax=Rossellomorea sp. SC111 TaxID=2968985 RepID=UPI00215A644D|nr:hypothetical protein [Rossellomorea sp. SC111]MCR8848283.1 hypothetical protein [Rossellomorea sp. SC111]